MIVLLILVLLCSLSLGILWNAARRLVNTFTRSKPYSLDETLEFIRESGAVKEDPRRQFQWESFTFQSHDGLKLIGQKHPGSPEKVLVLVHGHRSNWLGMGKYLPPFMKDNWSIYIYDQRFHGESPGDYCTGGILEKRDLLLLLKRLREEYPQATLAVLGESMGGAIVLQLQDLHPPVDCSIAICPYSDLEDLFRYHLKRHWIFWLWQDLAIRFCNQRFKKITGYPIGDVSPRKSLEQAKNPLLILHGSEDGYVPTAMSEELAGLHTDKVELCVVPGGTHGKSVSKNPDVFWSAVEKFIKKNRSNQVEAETQ